MLYTDFLKNVLAVETAVMILNALNKETIS